MVALPSSGHFCLFRPPSPWLRGLMQQTTPGCHSRWNQLLDFQLQRYKKFPTYASFSAIIFAEKWRKKTGIIDWIIRPKLRPKSSTKIFDQNLRPKSSTKIFDQKLWLESSTRTLEQNIRPEHSTRTLEQNIYLDYSSCKFAPLYDRNAVTS